MNKYDFNIIVGVDLGISKTALGGISFFDSVSDELLSIYPMPTKTITKGEKDKNLLDIDKLYSILEIPKLHKDSVLVVYEDVHAFGDAGFGVGSLMLQRGILEGLIKGFGYQPFPVSPKTWQKHFGIVCPKILKSKESRKKYLKDNSRRVAQELFPEFSHRFELKLSHGLSDSALIGKFYLSTQEI